MVNSIEASVREERSGASAPAVFLNQFKDYMVVILLVCMGGLFVIGNIAEAIVVGAIAILNAVMGFALEFRNGKTIRTMIVDGPDTGLGEIVLYMDGRESSNSYKSLARKRFDVLRKYIISATIFICLFIFILGTVRDEDFIAMLDKGIGLVAALLPVGLTTVITITMAFGVQRMAKKNVRVNKLTSLETLGCADVIYFDKKGMLTQNKMEVRKIYIAGAEELFDVGILSDKRNPIREKCRHLTEIAVCCNNAGMDLREQFESALIEMAEDSGFDLRKYNDINTRIYEYPFEPERKCMSVVVKKPDGEKYIFTKGDPDFLLKKCVNNHTFDSALWANHNMSGDALKVIAFASAKIEDDEWAEFPRRNFETNLNFIGMAGLAEPLRPEAKTVVTAFETAGIKPCIVTEDEENMAVAAAKELGIWETGDRALTGYDIDKMSGAELEKAILKTKVYADISPKHKVTIVKAMKKAGYICAMACNIEEDSPAVREADIGIAIGGESDGAVQAAADIVLTEDNLSEAASAAEEGRSIHNNIRKAIRYLLSCNVGEILVLFFAIIAGMPLPLLPLQVLWINSVANGIPAAALSLEKYGRNGGDRRVSGSYSDIFSDGLLWTIILRGVLMGVSVLMVFSSIYYLSGDLTRARTSAFATLALSQLVHLFECKSEKSSIFEISLLGNLYTFGSVLLSGMMILSVIYIPILREIFKTCSLAAQDWCFVIGFALLGACCGSANRAAKSLASLFKDRLKTMGEN